MAGKASHLQEGQHNQAWWIRFGTQLSDPTAAWILQLEVSPVTLFQVVHGGGLAPGSYQNRSSSIHWRTIIQLSTHLLTGYYTPGTVLGAVRDVREKRSLCISQLRLSSQMPQLGNLKQAYFLCFLELQDQVSAGLAPFMDLQPSCPVSPPFPLLF